MVKKVQLQDLDNNENVYPLTDIDAVDGLEERLKAVEDREDKDTIFDPSDIEKRLDVLEASGNGLTKDEADELYEPKKPENLISKEEGANFRYGPYAVPFEVGFIKLPFGVKKDDKFSVSFNSRIINDSEFGVFIFLSETPTNDKIISDIFDSYLIKDYFEYTLTVAKDSESAYLIFQSYNYMQDATNVVVVKGDKPYTWEEIYGSDGGSYDDTALKQWVSDTYIAKGTDTNSLVQVDGNGRAIFDNDSFSNAGVGTQIPTVRSIKTELSQYLKTGDVDLDAYVTSESLTSDLTNLKSEILGGAGEDYNTLKKIEEWVEEHQDLYQALISTISEKAGKDENADMATQTYVEGEVDTLIEELGKKSNVVVCNNQYEFDQILTKDSNTIYLIKGDQDQWFSKEDGNELYDFYGELLQRVQVLERLNGITEYGDENNE